MRAPSQRPSIRPAVSADVPAIVALLADDPLGRAREDLSQPLAQAYRDAWRELEADPNQIVVVVDDGGQVVGCLQLTLIPGLSRAGMWRGQIEGVRVAAGQRGLGLGRQMIEWAIERCRERGCGLVQLTSDRSRTQAQAFYESLGFAASHVGFKLDLG